MPQSTGGAVAQRVLSAAAKAVASAVIVRVTQSTDTPAHKRAARNIMARAAAAGQVHVVAPARLVRHLQNNSRSSPLVKYTQRLASGVQTRDRLS